MVNKINQGIKLHNLFIDETKVFNHLKTFCMMYVFQREIQDENDIFLR